MESLWVLKCSDRKLTMLMMVLFLCTWLCQAGDAHPALEGIPVQNAVKILPSCGEVEKRQRWQAGAGVQQCGSGVRGGDSGWQFEWVWGIQAQQALHGATGPSSHGFWGCVSWLPHHLRPGMFVCAQFFSFFLLPTSSLLLGCWTRDSYLPSMRNWNQGCSHFPHSFRSSYEYLNSLFKLLIFFPL